ncbi:MAG: carboxypeptidase-like regulatory domain-containing protein, partial [Flavobacteriaceae bacterium]
MKQLLITIVFLQLGILGIAQETLNGTVGEAAGAADQPGLAGVNVYWQDSQIGTVTDIEGKFSIPYSTEHNRLIISHVGYSPDTLRIDSPRIIQHFLRPDNQLDEVVLEQEKEAVQKAFYTTQNVVTVNSAELLKAACCNLSESFETNPAIDVNYNDALTGTKQIQMLGLTSPYLLITQENIPMVRGASQTYGLTFTPGTWIESIQITKGAGSVMNGFESISGQINTELLKPSNEELLFINGYANRNGRLELNTHLNGKLNEKWSTGLFIHGNRRDVKVDNNGDGFLDAPLANQINLMNRWQFQDSDRGWISFFNIRYLRDKKQIGESIFEPENDRL